MLLRNTALAIRPVNLSTQYASGNIALSVPFFPICAFCHMDYLDSVPKEPICKRKDNWLIGLFAISLMGKKVHWNKVPNWPI